MYNFWFAIEDEATESALRKGIGESITGKASSEIKINWLSPAPKPKRAFANFSKLLKEDQPDVLFYESSHETFPSKNVMKRVPTVIILNSTQLRDIEAVPPPQENPKYTQQTRPKLDSNARNKEMISLAAGLVVGSEWAKRQLIEAYNLLPSKVLVLHTGLDINKWDLDLASHQASNLELPEKVRLLFVGNDFHALGGDLLLNMLDSDHDLALRYELNLVINHSVVTHMGAALKRRNVHTHSYFHFQKEAAKHYLNADIFVMPARIATDPDLLSAALATGLPVIASRVEGLTELVQDGKNGLLVEPDNNISLAAAINALINDPEKRAEMGGASRSLAEAAFNSLNNAQQVLTFLKQITGEVRVKQNSKLPLPRLVNSYNSL